MSKEFAFLGDGGRLATLIGETDWASTPLGPIDGWPQYLKTATSIILRAPVPMALLWGSDGVMIYNDAYAAIVGARHPAGLGATVHDAWPEARAFNEHVLRVCLAGETLSFARQEMSQYFPTHDHAVFLDLNYSPVLDHDGVPGGVLAVVVETTDAVLAERGLRGETHTLETLNLTGAALAAELELEPLIQMVTDAGVKLTGAQFGAYFHNLMDETGEKLHLFTLAGAERAAFETLGRPRATAVFGPTFRNEGVIRSDDILADPRYGRSAPHYGMPKGHLPVRSYLSVPVTSRSGAVLGGLLFGHSAVGRFTERHERLLVGVAAQAAIAIDNARLFKAVQDVNDTLEQRVVERTLELTEAHEALRQAQKMETLGQLTGGIAHDFNNLLTVIRGSADLLKRPDLTEDRRTRYIAAIADTADRATKLTNQLLAFARRSSLTPTIVDARTILHGMTDMIATLSGAFIEVSMRLPDEPCLVNADASQLETAIVNLAVNARDAMHQRGRLTIDVDAAKRIPAVRGHAAQHGDFVRISIRDTGTGIDPAHIEHIFEPFFTSKAVGHGTGLGLSQVFGFVKQSGGEVIVDSVPGEGATFALYLPRERNMTPIIADPEPAICPEQASLRILVVEDNPDVGNFAISALADLGHAIVFARDAEEALDVLDGQTTRFDVVFSDVMMPGMTGIELGREIRRRYPETAILLTSGYSEVISREGSHGFDLLRKPYSMGELAAALQRATAAFVE
ncbi:ATP-binding protein [Sphingomonas sp. PP-F2F-A104-K0414]|uniref:ATP-binding protein n=1 Tax=Sphingomonas sp. PP-F2F-A104-K0414 TaxID=2135661 RepID=UPI001404D0B0|nr:ATP-binding protein [Sphingomonas sp. PP-F2F-A104-K0414]